MAKRCCLELVTEEQFSEFLEVFKRERNRARGNLELFKVSKNIVMASLFYAGLSPFEASSLNVYDVAAKEFQKKAKIYVRNGNQRIIRIMDGSVFRDYNEDRFWLIDDLILADKYHLKLGGSYCHGAYLINEDGRRTKVSEVREIFVRFADRLASQDTAACGKIAIRAYF
ncbi:MAG: hypothetical protein AABY07_01995 [Nanoarchaeota archaeon]